MPEPTKTLPSDVLISVNQWLRMIVLAKQQIESFTQAYGLTFEEAVTLASEREATFTAINDARIHALEQKLAADPQA